MNLIYFDNSATSWPKPKEVGEAMMHFLNEVGASPGRSGHRLAVESGRILYEARETLSELFHIPDPLRLVFCSNATEALNLALNGLLSAGDHVITSSVEHNSVMRPLRALEKKGVELTCAPCSPEGLLDPNDLEKSIQLNTKMIVLNHASNALGTLLPVKEVGNIARRHDILLLVDAAQTAGSCTIDVQGDCIDLLAFTGHKALYGPPGTGGLYIGERIDIKNLIPLKTGGTGSRSEHEEQPDFLPDLCESGTPNIMGLAGLEAGARFVLEQGVENIRQRESELLTELIDSLSEIPDITLYGTRNPGQHIATLSFNINGLPPSETGLVLDEKYGILCRVGLHCTPAAHRTAGTFPDGTVRFSLGFFNTKEEIKRAVDAVREIAKNNGKL